MKRKEKKEYKRFLKNNLISLVLVITLICLGGVFAGNVIIKEGDMDVDGNLEVTGTISGANVGDEGCRAYSDTDVTAPTNTNFMVPLNQERYDTDDMHDNSANNTRITIKTAGKYLVTGHLVFDINNTGFRHIGIRVNGATYIAAQRFNTNQGSYSMLTVATIYEFAANDYVELQAYQTSGGDLDLKSIGNYAQELVVQRLV